MANTDNFGLEFLDLSGVDEYERSKVLTSLQPSQSNFKFPWFIGDESFKASAVEGDSTTNSEVQTSRVNPENGLFLSKSKSNNNLPPVVSANSLNGPINAHPSNQFYNPVPQYYAPATVVTTIPSVHYGNFAASPPHLDVAPASYPTYIPPVYPAKPAVFYGVPPAQTVFLQPSPAVDASFYAPNYQTTSQTYIENDIVVEPQISAELEQILPVSTKQPSSLSADSPAFTPKNLQHPVEPRAVPVEKPSENVTAEAPKQESVWASKKSFASLFEGAKPGAAAGRVNGIAKIPDVVSKNSAEATCPIKNPRRGHFVDPDCYRMGEFLKKYSVDGRTISLQPRGLINQSNYCYINSILQALIACPPMYNLLSGLAGNITSNAKRKPTPVIDGMCKFAKEYKLLPANMRVNNRRSEGGKKDQKRDQGALINTDIPFEPSWIYKILHGLQTDLMEGRQEDAEEFLGCLLNHLSDEMLELMKLVDTPDKSANEDATSQDDDTWQVMGNKNKGVVLRKTEFERTPITDIFGGSLKSRINRAGGLMTENTQPFLTLPLNIEKVKTVEEALEALTTKNQLEGLTSSKTNEEVEAWQQVMLDELPVVLILHLKCFDFKLDGCTKIVKALEFPIDLKLEGKLLSVKTTNAKEKQYKLFAVVYHDGKEASKGHYLTDAFHVGYSSWLRYDDASVKQVQEEHVLKPQGTRVPYLLFYRRSDTIRSR